MDARTPHKLALRILLILGLGSTGFLLAGRMAVLLAGNQAVTSETGKEEGTMLNNTTSTASLAKPPVDMAAPRHTKTATFALG